MQTDIELLRVTLAVTGQHMPSVYFLPTSESARGSVRIDGVTAVGSADGRITQFAAVPGPSSYETMFCDKCNCEVTARDHAARCSGPSDVPASVRRLAWVGDSLWSLFVRSSTVEAGLPSTSVESFVTNQWLAATMPAVRAAVELGDCSEMDCSDQTKAAYVRAAMSVSAVARQLVASKLPSPYVLRAAKLRPPHILLQFPHGEFHPQATFDGYCYLLRIDPERWKELSVLLGPNPYYRDVRPYVVAQPDTYVWADLKKKSTVLHMSPVKLPGMKRYLVDTFEIPDDMRVGGKKVVNLTVSLMTRSIDPSWVSTGLDVMFDQLAVGVRRFDAFSMDLFVTSRNWSFIKQVLFDDTSRARAVEAAFVKLLRALSFALVVLDFGIDYIDTAGVLSARRRVYEVRELRDTVESLELL